MQTGGRTELIRKQQTKSTKIWVRAPLQHTFNNLREGISGAPYKHAPGLISYSSIWKKHLSEGRWEWDSERSSTDPALCREDGAPDTASRNHDHC